MHFSVLPTWAAPLSTGHPFGLPDATGQSKTGRTKSVPAVSPQSSTDSGMMQEKSPTQFWRATGGQADWRATGGQPDLSAHVAPPSIMQLKISELLNRQAHLLSDRDAGAASDPRFQPQTKQDRTDKAATATETATPPETATLKPAAPVADQRPVAANTGYGQVPGLPGRESTEAERSTA